MLIQVNFFCKYLYISKLFYYFYSFNFNVTPVKFTRKYFVSSMEFYLFMNMFTMKKSSSSRNKKAYVKGD